ncbi:MAG: hypothetical protein J6U01_05450 [Clostridia bacterium]|nr:hypothetical protein [Clostridia bacterium]
MDNVEYMKNYEKENLRQIRLKINRKTEPELLEWIEKQENIQGYIKRIILEDMKKQEGKKMYKIKPEYMDLWGEDATEETIITKEELEMIARGWEKDPEELLDQLIEVSEE